MHGIPGVFFLIFLFLFCLFLHLLAQVQERARASGHPQQHEAAAAAAFSSPFKLYSTPRFHSLLPSPPLARGSFTKREEGCSATTSRTRTLDSRRRPHPLLLPPPYSVFACRYSCLGGGAYTLLFCGDIERRTGRGKLDAPLPLHWASMNGTIGPRCVLFLILLPFF